MTITVQVQGDAIERLQALLDRMDDATPAMREIAEALRDRAEEAFALEGPGWHPLAPATVKQRGNAHPILQRSGQLASSLAIAYGRDYAAVGTAKIYGAIHQFGGQAGRGGKTRIPARPYLPMQADGTLTPAAERSVLDIIERHLLAERP